MALESRTQAEAQNRRAEGQVIARALFPALGLALSLVLALAGCASNAQKAEDNMRAIQAESDAKTLLERGRAFAYVGDQTRAEEYLAAALNAGADPRDVMPLLMEVCVHSGRYRSAIQHGENHLRHHPGDVNTRLMVGALYAAIGEPEHAREHLEMVIQKPLPPPEKLHGQAHYYLGIVARDTKDPVAADRHFREYLRIEPNGSHVEEAKGSLLLQVPQPPPQSQPQTTPVPAPPPDQQEGKKP